MLTILIAQIKTLTLEECLKLGLENSNLLKISQSQVESSRAKIREAKSHLLPRLTLNAGYTKLSTVPPFRVNLPISPVPVTIQEAILDNYNVKLSINQPLFTGMRLRSLKKAQQYNNNAEESTFSHDANEVSYAIYSAFWNYYKTKKILELALENCKQLEKLVTDTKYFLQNGLVTRNDLLKLEVQYANLKLNKIESENAVNLSRASLNKLLGYNLAEQTEILVDTTDITPEKYNLKELINEAVKQREQLKGLVMRIKSCEKYVTAANSGWFPAIYLYGNYYYNKPNQRFMPLQDEFNDSWDIGISLSWDLWNWRNTSSKISQAKQQLIQIQSRYEEIKKNIEMEVYQSYLHIISAEDKIEVNKIALTQAEENYRITTEKYNQQLVTSSDLIDAEVMLTNAKTQYTHALVDYQLTKVKLEKSIGRKIY